MVKLKDIDGVMIDKLQSSIESADRTHQDAVLKDLRNQVKKLGSVDIGLNRERLATFLYQRERVILGLLRNWPVFEELPETNPVKGSYRDLADAIISAEATLLERKGK